NDRTPESGNNLGQELKTLAGQFRCLEAWAGYVAARPMKTRDQAVSNRIGARRHDDWDSLRDSFRRPDCRCAFGHDDIQPQSNQLGCDLRSRASLALGKAFLAPNVLPPDPAVFFQGLPKCL